MARVSYSQYGMYSSCQQQYKLNYIDKLGISNANIHLIFGSAMHEVVQHFLDVMYNVSKKQALQLPGINHDKIRPGATWDGCLTSASLALNL